MPRPLASAVLSFSLLTMSAASACEQNDKPPPPAEPAASKTPPAPPPIEPVPAAKPGLPVATAPRTAEPPASPSEPKAAPVQRPRKRRPVRVINPQPGQTGCIEMYGSCTSDTPAVCTSSALYLDCGKRGQRPDTGEPLHCVCP